jgi:hypothetical protein
MNVKRLLPLFVGIACLSLSANTARACQCVEYGTPVCAQYWRADAVFVGQVREITARDDSKQQTWPTATLHFIVEQPFRGITTATVDVETLSGTSCDMKFEKGRRYLIFAARDSESKGLFAGPCMGTSEVKYAGDALNYIRSVTQQGATESISGRLAEMKYDPYAGVKVEVSNKTKTFETTSDQEGRFQVSLPGPGAYTVTMRVPSSVGAGSSQDNPIQILETTDTSTTIQYTVEVGKGQCDYREVPLYRVDLHATAEISGSVLTASGRPVDKGWIYLRRAADADRSEFQKIEANGSFKFEGVPVGEFFLVLNPRNEAPEKNDAPYPRTFYPNAPDESGATKIVVAEGAKLENLILRVGPALKARRVSGSVVLDGAPAAKAHVSLYNGERYVQMFDVDKKGLFSFDVYGDFNYFISAEVLGEVWAKSERVAITNKSTNLKLVLKPK